MINVLLQTKVVLIISRHPEHYVEAETLYQRCSDARWLGSTNNEANERGSTKHFIVLEICHFQTEQLAHKK